MTRASRTITINMGMKMTAWYDILSLDPDRKVEDLAGMNSSKDVISKLVDEEVDEEWTTPQELELKDP